MASVKGDETPEHSPTQSLSNDNLNEPTSPRESSDSFTLSSATVCGDTTPSASSTTQTAAMDYDPMMMDDDQALGPSVKIHEVSATRSCALSDALLFDALLEWMN
jgi:hypothetical protein